MKSAYLLDTDWAIDFLNGRQEIVEKIRELKGNGLALSLVSLAELYEGVYYSRGPEESRRKLEDFLSGVEIIALEEGICQTFERTWPSAAGTNSDRRFRSPDRGNMPVP
jgi:predicted nucleic acid-binding protein